MGVAGTYLSLRNSHESTPYSHQEELIQFAKLFGKILQENHPKVILRSQTYLSPSLRTKLNWEQIANSSDLKKAELYNLSGSNPFKLFYLLNSEQILVVTLTTQENSENLVITDLTVQKMAATQNTPKLTFDIAAKVFLELPCEQPQLLNTENALSPHPLWDNIYTLNNTSNPLTDLTFSCLNSDFKLNFQNTNSTENSFYIKVHELWGTKKNSLPAPTSRPQQKEIESELGIKLRESL